MCCSENIEQASCLNNTLSAALTAAWIVEQVDSKFETLARERNDATTPRQSSERVSREGLYEVLVFLLECMAIEGGSLLMEAIR